MEKLSREQIKTYLEKVIAAEASVYTLNKATEKLQYEKERKPIKSPTMVYIPDPPCSYGRHSIRFRFVTDIIWISLVAILAVYLFAFHLGNLGNFIRCFAFAILAILAFYPAADLVKIEKYKKYDEKLWNTYWNEKQIADRKTEALSASLDSLSSSLAGTRSESQRILDKLYSQNIIHPKYRNFIAVASLYDYFDTGRVDALEGPYGAYNLFESELRMNMIICKLDEISRNLNLIRQNQYALYREMTEIDHKLATVSNSISGIENMVSKTESQIADIQSNIQKSSDYLEVMQLNSETIKQNTEISLWLQSRWL